MVVLLPLAVGFLTERPLYCTVFCTAIAPFPTTASGETSRDFPPALTATQILSLAETSLSVYTLHTVRYSL